MSIPGLGAAARPNRLGIVARRPLASDAEIEQDTQRVIQEASACRRPTIARGARRDSDARRLPSFDRERSKDAAYNDIACVYGFRARGGSGRSRGSTSGRVTGAGVVTATPSDKLPRRPAMAAVPAQDRQVAGATGQDRVQGSRCRNEHGDLRGLGGMGLILSLLRDE